MRASQNFIQDVDYQVFPKNGEYPKGGSRRPYLPMPLFCAVDVAEALGYANPAKAVIDHCKGVTVLEPPTNGGVAESNFGLLFKIRQLPNGGSKK